MRLFPLVLFFQKTTSKLSVFINIILKAHIRFLNQRRLTSGLPWWLSSKESSCTAVTSLGQEYPLEKENGNHSSILAWEIQWTESLVGYSLWGHKESDMTLQLNKNKKIIIYDK